MSARTDPGRRVEQSEGEQADGRSMPAAGAESARPPETTRPAGPGRLRPVIEDVRPQVDGGRFPAKASIGELLVVEADVFAEGHDLLWCEVRHQHESERRWSVVPMSPLANDRWQAGFPVHRLGRYRFAVRAGIDRFGTWRRDLLARAGAGQDLSLELLVGAELLEAMADDAAAGRGPTDGPGASGDGVVSAPADAELLRRVASVLRAAPRGLENDAPELDGVDHDGTVAGLLASRALAALTARHRDEQGTATGEPLPVLADPVKARTSTWYELFPRSASPDADRPGTLADVERRLDYVAALGADVLYLPPVHPIGTTNRKGADGSTEAAPGDPGSPWAIGSADGGHTAVDPGLGTLDDLRHLAAAAAERGIDLALDLAFQCSPDHPWVDEHPEWFRHLPDGSIRYAENPPKRYEDIYPLDFETADWEALWLELLGVVRFWIDQGVSVFRVDNPHTKPFRFWEWLIASVKAEHPEVLFLSEAFTRPKVMHRLAKLGFSQSYTYFTWRSTKWELESYLTELTRSPAADYFRPNFWPNTPDILTEELQQGGTPAFLSRLVLAATLAANYGIYGPAFELQEREPRHDGSEEYRHSEKYAVRHWDLDDPRSLGAFVARVNRIRHENPALHHDRTLRFHRVDNDQLLAYSKTFLVEPPFYLGEPPAHLPRDPNVVLVVVNLDHRFQQSGWVDLDLRALGIDPERPYEAHELLTDSHYRWEGYRSFVILDPDVVPAHVFRIHQAPAEASP
ncbi:MAG: alpha-1,4-glucan--maltose-1-phosphate maltosyltransferase [Acidimicrobiales bacterium]